MKGEGLRKGAWTQEEDFLLKKCIQTYGEGNLHQIPARAGLNRCRKSCRLRWLNYLKPGLNRGELQEDEVDLILRLHKLLGNRWSLIAGRIPGRTANDVKNYWNTHLAKKFKPSSRSANLPKKQNQKTKVNAIRPRPWNSKNLYLVRDTYDPQFNINQGKFLHPPPPPPPSNDMSWLETFLDDSYDFGEGGGSGGGGGCAATSEGHSSASDKNLQGGSLWSGDIDEELCFDDTQLWDLLIANDNGEMFII